MDDTRRWVDELHELNSSFIPQQPTRDVGTVGMSRDSLNGTLVGNFDYQPTTGSITTRQVTPQEEGASIKIQRWYRKKNLGNRPRTNLEQHNEAPDEKTPTPSPRASQQQERNSSRRSSVASSTSGRRVTPKASPRASQQQERNSSRRPSSASSTSGHQMTPKPSSRPPSARSDRVKAVSSNSIPSVSSSTSTVTSKVTLDDVYETLKKLEEVEQFPAQPPLQDDSGLFFVIPEYSVS